MLSSGCAFAAAGCRNPPPASATTAQTRHRCAPHLSSSECDPGRKLTGRAPRGDRVAPPLFPDADRVLADGRSARSGRNSPGRQLQHRQIGHRHAAFIAGTTMLLPGSNQARQWQTPSFRQLLLDPVSSRSERRKRETRTFVMRRTGADLVIGQLSVRDDFAHYFRRPDMQSRRAEKPRHPGGRDVVDFCRLGVGIRSSPPSAPVTAWPWSSGRRVEGNRWWRENSTWRWLVPCPSIGPPTRMVTSATLTAILSRASAPQPLGRPHHAASTVTCIYDRISNGANIAEPFACRSACPGPQATSVLRHVPKCCQ